MKLDFPSTLISQKVSIFTFLIFLKITKVKTGLGFRDCITNNYRNGSLISNYLFGYPFTNDTVINNGGISKVCCNTTQCYPSLANQTCFTANGSSFWCNKISQKIFCGGTSVCGGIIENTPISSNVTIGICNNVNYDFMENYLQDAINFDKGCRSTDLISSYYNILNCDNNCTMGTSKNVKYIFWNCVTSNCVKTTYTNITSSNSSIITFIKRQNTAAINVNDQGGEISNCGVFNKYPKLEESLSCNWDNDGWTCYNQTALVDAFSNSKAYDDIKLTCFLQWRASYPQLNIPKPTSIISSPTSIPNQNEISPGVIGGIVSGTISGLFIIVIVVRFYFLRKWAIIF